LSDPNILISEQDIVARVDELAKHSFFWRTLPED
jgi:hypothetical protein